MRMTIKRMFANNPPVLNQAEDHTVLSFSCVCACAVRGIEVRSWKWKLCGALGRNTQGTLILFCVARPVLWGRDALLFGRSPCFGTVDCGPVWASRPVAVISGALQEIG